MRWRQCGKLRGQAPPASLLSASGGQPIGDGVMPRILAVLPFESQQRRPYLYDDNTGMVFPATSATVRLLQEHCDKDLDAAAGVLSGEFSEAALLHAVDFVGHWETKFGAFYRSAERTSEALDTMPDCSPHSIAAAVRAHGLRHLVLTVTENCNLRCRYCYYSDAYPVSRNRTVRTMSVETGRRAIDYFFAQTKPAMRRNPLRALGLSFYGGEPLLEEGTIRTLTAYARASADFPLVFAITTNGTRLTEAASAFLVENEFHILVSLDGPQIDHDRNRVFADGGGSFDVVVSNLRRFRCRYPNYSRIHLTAVGDFKSDLLRLSRFFTENSDWLPRLQIYSSVNNRQTRYYEQFSEDDTRGFQHAHRLLRNVYLDSILTGAEVPHFAQVYFGARVSSVAQRRRHLLDPEHQPRRYWLPAHRDGLGAD